MPGRLVQAVTSAEIQAVFGMYVPEEIESNYNTAPDEKLLCVVSNNEGLAVDRIKWGIETDWSVQKGYGLINVRADTLLKKQTFATEFKDGRCIVPVSGFYEWKQEGGRKFPCYFTLIDKKPLWLAGIYHSETVAGKEKRTVAVITTDPNDLVAQVHDRGPVILTPEQAGLWLDKGRFDPKELALCFIPYPAREIEYVPVSKKMNAPEYKAPDCITPIQSPVRIV